MAATRIADANGVFRDLLATEQRRLELDAFGFAVGYAGLEFSRGHFNQMSALG